MMKRTHVPLLVTMLAATAWAQGADNKPDPKVAEQIKELKVAVGDRQMEKDALAIQQIDVLNNGFESMVPADQREVIKVLGEIFTRAKQREPEKSALYDAASRALSKMGKPAGNELKRAYEDQKFRKKEWVRMRGNLLRRLGEVKDEAHVKYLLDRARRDPEDEILAAAGEALGNYAESDQKIRKDIFEGMLIKFGEIHSGANAGLDPGDTQLKSHKDTLTRISDPWNTTMAKLSGESFRTAPDWRNWWNNHGKSGNWDKGRK